MGKMYLVCFVGLVAVLIIFVYKSCISEDCSISVGAGKYNHVTTISLDSVVRSVGTMKISESRDVVFEIVNTGEHPLIIRNVQSTCGCTDVVWNKAPVLPGKSGKIKVKFKPNSLGAFHKSISVICNTDEKLHRLSIRGNVI